MSLKLVIPRDPLIFRDGKPFTAVPGERAKSMLFPFPATLAGAVRTREGAKADGKFDTALIDELKKLSIRGPFLVELDENKITQWYFPAPADALLIDKDKEIKIYSLAPLEVENGITDLDAKLKLVGTKEIVKDKPMKKPPLYWDWELMQAWLLNPDGDLDLTNAIRGPESETRTHVSIDAKTQTALSGALFQTSGMEFINKNKKLSEATQLALAIETSATFGDGVDSLGGERRVVHWGSSDEPLLDCPQNIKDQIKKDGHCRLILVTPAYFIEGYLPAAFEKKYNLEIQAVALPRYQTISGWDYAANEGKGAPKETRRLVPTGSVYFIKFNDGTKIENFIKEIWLNSICEKDSQEARDGFGVALLGTWNGEPRKMEVKND
jgi:CRISPR-associated protein Cmr3